MPGRHRQSRPPWMTLISVNCSGAGRLAPMTRISLIAENSMTQTLEATTSAEVIGTDALRPNREVVAKASASGGSPPCGRRTSPRRTGQPNATPT
jgi:hypothetical protein